MSKAHPPELKKLMDKRLTLKLNANRQVIQPLCSCSWWAIRGGMVGKPNFSLSPGLCVCCLFLHVITGVVSTKILSNFLNHNQDHLRILPLCFIKVFDYLNSW